MHEMSLAEGVMRIAEETALKEGAGRVTRVVLEIGRLSAVEPEALNFCLDVASRGTRAEGAVFEMIDLPGAGWCMQCSREIELQQVYGECPLCGSAQVQVTGGTEMRVKELEIE